MPATTISSAAVDRADDPTYTFRVDARVIATRRDSGPVRNMDYATAVEYAEFLLTTGRYVDVRIDLDTF